MISCLRTGDDEAANECLARITLRFGDKHERVLALRGLLKEATACGNSELQSILEEYDALLQENDANVVGSTRVPPSDNARLNIKAADSEEEGSSSPINGQDCGCHRGS